MQRAPFPSQGGGFVSRPKVTAVKQLVGSTDLGGLTRRLEARRKPSITVAVFSGIEGVVKQPVGGTDSGGSRGGWRQAENPLSRLRSLAKTKGL